MPSLANRPPFLEEICKDDGFVVEELPPTLTSVSLHTFVLELSRLFGIPLIQYLSLTKICRHLESSPGERERLGLVRLLLFRSCSGALAHIAEKHPAPALNVDFAIKKQTTQLSGLLTSKRLQGLVERRICYAVETVLPFVTALTEALVLCRGAT